MFENICTFENSTEKKPDRRSPGQTQQDFDMVFPLARSGPRDGLPWTGIPGYILIFLHVVQLFRKLTCELITQYKRILASQTTSQINLKCIKIVDLEKIWYCN